MEKLCYTLGVELMQKFFKLFSQNCWQVENFVIIYPNAKLGMKNFLCFYL